MIAQLLRRVFWSALLALLVLVGCGTDAATPPSGGGKHLGEACAKTEDCASSLCVRVDERGGICSQACTEDSSCPRGDNWGCVPAPPQTFSVCACVRLGDRELCEDGLDNDCNGAADDCRYCDGQRVSNDDPEHCGGCGNACRADQACRLGACECRGLGTECNGTCPDLQNDAQNCGECGKRCGPDQTCRAGQCACETGPTYCEAQGCFDLQTDADHCGDCDTICTEGQVCRALGCACPDAGRGDFCPGVGCVDRQTDPKHCGECGSACPDGQSCLSGDCVCAAGRSACEDGCKDTESDPENCGECGNECPAPLTCIQGECGCTGAGYSICGERCAALRTDPQHCGGCGRACAPGETCASGECQCPSGLSCSGACVRENDDANCGACGNACPSGQRCAGATCVCEGSGLSQCGADCLNLSNDEQSCGVCDEACNDGETCNFGTCQCPYGTTYCSGSSSGCVALSQDPRHCGTCGKKCNPTEVCSGGQCACPGYGQTYCAALGACVDVLSSTAHCGACTTKCAAGEACQNGSCGCPSFTEQYCASEQTCTDTYSNDQHCGGCDQACPAGTHCSFGNCACESGKTLCEDSKCYDLSSNVAHCGLCTNACSANQVCTFGQCGCAPPAVGKEVRLTTTATHESAPVVAFNGTNVGVLYVQAAASPAPANLRFALLKPDGTLISDSALTAFTSADAGDTVLNASALTWSGAEFALVYLRQKAFSTSQVVLQRLNASGASKGAAVVVSEPPAGQSVTGPVAVAWSASYGGYAVSYHAPAGIVFRRVGAMGTSLGSENSFEDGGGSGRSAQLLAAPNGTWALNASGNLAWFNADGSRTLPILTLAGDTSLANDGSGWLATSGDDDSLYVQRGTTKNQALLWQQPFGQEFSDHTTTMVGGNLAVLLAEGSTWFGPTRLKLQRFVLPASATSTVLTAPTPPVDVLVGQTCPLEYQKPHNFALAATGTRALLAVWADSRWGASSELYSAPIDIPVCP